VGALRKLRPSFAARSIFFCEGILLIPLAALIASGPRILRGVSCGHDFEFHLISWLETQRNWSQGVLYPHWAQTPNWSAGEPRFVFYPPLTWMLGALLGYAIPWQWVPAVLTFVFLAGTGLATRALARKFFPAPTATFAGVLAAATPYAFFTAYERTAFSELASACWIPLLLLFAWRQAEFGAPRRAPLAAAIDAREVQSPLPVPCSRFPALDGSAAPLALSLAAVWLTNAPAGVMASYLLAFAAVASALLRRQWWPVLRAAIAAPIALGLAAFYLVPAAWEQRWIDIRQAVDVGMRVGDSWLFARHASPDLALHDQVLRSASLILVLTVVLAAIALTLSLIGRKLPSSSRVFYIPLALLVPIIFLFQFPISAPAWRLLPKLEFLQFPWRWLTVLGIPYAIFLAIATPLQGRRARVWSSIGWTAVLILLACLAGHFFFQICDEEDQISNQVTVFQAGTGVEGTDEYAAAASDNSLIPTGLPDGCLVSDPAQELGESESGATPVWYPEQGTCDDTYTAQLWQNEYKLLQIESDHDGFVVLRLSRYPAWQITVNRKSLTVPAVREDGLVVVPVSAGASSIEARWSITPDVLWGRWISLTSLVLLAALWRVERRIGAVHLS
jgi:hypothetical protein